MTLSLATIEADGAAILSKLPQIAADLNEAAVLTGFIPGTAAAELTLILKTAAIGATALSSVSASFLGHVAGLAADLQALEAAIAAAKNSSSPASA